MTASTTETRRDRQDIKIGIARGMGMTIEKAAEFAGCSVRKVSYKQKESEVLEIAQWTEACRTSLEEAVNKVSKDEYKDSLEELLTDCKRILKKALKTEDLGTALKAVKQIEDRILGSPTQKVESKNFSAHVEVVQLPDGMLDQFLVAAKEYQLLTGAPQEEILEAEIVD